MAGIGFELKKLFQKRGLAATWYAPRQEDNKK